MTPTTPPSAEDKALAALVTAALHPWNHEVTMDEIAPYLTGHVVLSTEDEEALAGIQQRLLSKDKEYGKSEGHDAPEAMAAMLALHRQKPAEGFCQETEKEIERRRQELLAKLKEKRRDCAS